MGITAGVIGGAVALFCVLCVIMFVVFLARASPRPTSTPRHDRVRWTKAEARPQGATARSRSPWLPLTHGIAAAREPAGGATLASVGGEIVREVGVGTLYVVIGMMMLSYFEQEGRRRATLEVF